MTQEEQQTLVAGLCKELRELREQLDAEREITKRLREQLADPPLDIQEAVVKKLELESGETVSVKQLREQLDAEREARQLAEHNMTNWHQAAMRDAAALDAAVEALELLEIGAVAEIDRKVANAALEKVSDLNEK
jgi:hypothetical protein